MHRETGHGEMEQHTREQAAHEPIEQKSLQLPDSQSCPDVPTTLRMSMFHFQDDKPIPIQVQLDVQVSWATIKDPAFCQNITSVKHFRNRTGEEQETEEQITRLNKRFR